ncbi:helix-turn-helix domain-containing protein [Streptomyces sp. 1222.5]|uniref:helix-turn-helix domain-containing protein n=1 Tax=Streptomyces sp. 1222.5 TaxID=1881026 RepID=UPI003D761D36
MVNLSWDVWLVPQIADELRCGHMTVRRWMHRFNRWGLDLGRQAASEGTPKPNARGPSAWSRDQLGRLALQPSNVGRGRVRALGTDPGHASRRGPGPGHRGQPLPGAPDSAGRRRALAAHALVDALERRGL